MNAGQKELAHKTHAMQHRSLNRTPKLKNHNDDLLGLKKMMDDVKQVHSKKIEASKASHIEKLKLDDDYLLEQENKNSQLSNSQKKIGSANRRRVSVHNVRASFERVKSSRNTDRAAT